jgi:methionyl-tRNA synthetase
LDSTSARTLVTSALLYANGNVHLGHVAGAYLPADLYTRYLRSAGHDVIHVSGSDEHGAAITIRADDEGITPREVIDKYHPANEEAFRAFGIEFDIYGRTSWPEHHEVSQEFFLAAYQSGYIVDREEEQFFDADAGMFLPDRYVEGICPNCGHEGARGDQCDNCSATYNQNELKNPISKLSGKTPELRRTTHLYFQYGKFQDRLEEYVESHAGDWRDHVIGQARSWLKAGLGDRPITRDLSWGIDVPLPGFEGKKLYVWFDAPFGYITNTRVLTGRAGEPDGWKRWWCEPTTRYIPFIGKDNIAFHTLFFPASLMAYNESGREDRYILPDNVPACEFLNLEGRKFSKSKNWGIDLKDYLAEHPVDPLRYTIASNLPENRDVDFTWREYQARTNNELADILGNFINRTLQFAGRYFDGVIPPLAADQSENTLGNIDDRTIFTALRGPGPKEPEIKSLLAEDLKRLDPTQEIERQLEILLPKYMKYFTQHDLTMLMQLARAPRVIGELYESFRFRDAALETMNVARAANKYFNDSEPWKTRKSDPVRCATAINICLQTVRSLAILFEPIIPFSAKTILGMLGVERSSGERWSSAAELRLEAGSRLGEPAILFQKVEDELVEREVAKLGRSEQSAGSGIVVELKAEVTIEDVMKLDLRVATVLSAERVKKSDKLLKLQIRIGNLQRQIVAGIGRSYEPEELVGREIVVVANLKPAKLMGEESQGMLLAANSPENVPTLVTVMGESPAPRDGYVVR